MKDYSTNKRYFTSELEKNPTEKLPININIDNTKVLGIYANETHLGLHVRSMTDYGVCNYCGCIINRKKGYSTSVLVYAGINHRLLLVKIDNQKYKCLDCNKTTTEQLLDKAGLKRMTIDTLEGIMYDFSREESTSFASIGRKYSLTRTRIRQIFKETVKEEKIDYENIRHICIDENKIMQNKKLGYTYQLIVLDAPYRDTIINVFSDKVKIIPDNFHVVRQFSWAFSRTRRCVYENYGESKSKHWRILTKREISLKENSKNILDDLLKKFPNLNPAHKAKEMAYDIFTKDNELAPKESVEKYISKIKELKEFVQENQLKEFETPLETVKEWSEHIENIFIYPELSNGILERLNSSIKYIKRAARGFRNPEIMKKVVMLKVNNKKLG